MKMNRRYPNLMQFCSAIVLVTVAGFAHAFAPITSFYQEQAAPHSIAATDSNGNILWKENFRPFGERLNNEPASNNNRQWFHRKAADAETGLSYFGARYYDPEIDLVGLPRLDLTLHCPGPRVDLGFVEQLDPALEKTDARDASASLVVHLLRRKKSLFVQGEKDRQWADPVECLMDLHEARLEPQAKAFVSSLVKRNRKNI